jgi:hypothetical protein
VLVVQTARLLAHSLTRSLAVARSLLSARLCAAAYFPTRAAVSKCLSRRCVCALGLGDRPQECSMSLTWTVARRPCCFVRRLSGAQSVVDPANYAPVLLFKDLKQ